MKQRVYFFRWGITMEISFISSRMGSLAFAGTALEDPFPFVPFEVAGRTAIPSSSRRFFAAGSEDEGITLQTCWDIVLNSSI